MSEPTHAPGWRGKPRRSGPIVGMYDEQLPAWVRILEAVAPWGCFSCLILVALIVAYAYGADLLAGHLQ